MNKILSWIVIVVVVAGAVVGFWFAFAGDDTPGDNTAAVSESAGDAVAKINGVPISREKYERHYQSVLAVATNNGLDTSDQGILDSIKSKVLEDLISEELVLQSADSEGVVVAKEDIDNQMAVNRASFESDEEFSQALEAQGLDEAEFRKLVEAQLTIEKYLMSKIDFDAIVVTESEIQEGYDSAKAGNPELPPLDEVKDALIAGIRSERSTKLISDFVASLRSKSKVEVYI